MLFEDVEKYCMFIGYPRSGHTLLGSLLDAHPNAIIAHELDALHYVQSGVGREELYQLLYENSRNFAEEGSTWEGYGYRVPGQWQGRFDSLKVIGDKKGGGSTSKLRNHPELLSELRNTCADELKLIHVVRNPYDNISTMFLKRTGNRSMRRTMKNYFALCEINAEIKKSIGEDAIFEIKHEDFVQSPADHLQSLCRFLGLEAPEDYLSACTSQVFESPRQTRQEIGWSKPNREIVADHMRGYDFLQGYSY